MYCGNNLNNQDVLEGKKTIGSRYTCLLKGKSFGFDLPPDLSFLKPYIPIDKTKKYCGNSNILPSDYDRFGGLYECYLKGIGVGKKIKAETYYKSPSRKNRKSIRTKKSKNRKSIRSKKSKNRKSIRPKKSKNRKSIRTKKSKN